MQMPPPINQTFGVELELCLNEPSPNWIRNVARHIRSAGYPALGFGENQYGYSVWTVGLDITIPTRGEFERPMEITSRVLPLSAIKEVQDVVQQLDDNFFLRVVPYCGLHVHHGSAERGWPLRTIMNVMLIEVAFEHLLNQLHPWERCFTGDPTRSYTAPPSRAAMMAELPAGLARVRSILSHVTSLETLAQHVQDGGIVSRNAAVGLRGFWGNECCPQKRTIEFRQHEATTDPEAIEAWIELTATWVRYAHFVSEEDLGNLLLQCANETFELPDLLRYMGCEARIIDFYRSRLHNHEAETQHPQKDDFAATHILALLQSRRTRMLELEEDYLKAGKRSTQNVTILDPQAHSPRDKYVPWEELPFRYPWDAKMAASLNVPLRSGDQVDVARIQQQVRAIPVGADVFSRAEIPLSSRSPSPDMSP